MAARVIPFEDTDTVLNISITATDATPEGCILSTTQNSVSFTNNSGASISIAFHPGGIFSDINNLPAGQTSAPQPAPANASVNYCVTVGPAVNGPYAIQTGTGYMQVVVSTSGEEIKCAPDEVAIPLGGNLMLTPAASIDGYPVTWNNGDPFTQPITSVDNASHADNPQDGSGEFTYEVGGPGPKENPGGGGTVIVRST
jgi:hypothetical protein